MKVLVVDDSKTCRTLYRRELTAGGYEVVEAKDGVDALRVVQQMHVDLVVLDIEMPNMNGYEVCEHLRDKEFAAHFSTSDVVLPVIFVTSNEDVAWRVKGFSKGANGFINKGFKPGTLLTHVNEILKPKNPLSGLKALVVEDSRFLREVITSFLEEVEVVVTQTDTCEHAFQLLMHGSPFNFVITALEMPGMKGDQLCTHIRVDLGLKTLPLLVLTESESRGMLLNLFEAGASDYLVKPFEREELVGRLKAAVHMVKNLQQELEHKAWQESDDAKKARDQAQLATTVIHNIGNVLNSVFASCYQLSRLLNDSRLRQMLLAHKLMEDHEDDLATFITEDPRGRLLPEYLRKSGLRVQEEHRNMAREIEEVTTKINLMKDIIETQQLHAKTTAPEEIYLDELVHEAINVQQENLRVHRIGLDLQLDKTNPVLAKKAPLTHVLINLIKNAAEAMATAPKRKLQIRLEDDEDEVRLSLQDSGVGISEAHLNRIFTHGFTTKVDGHGFGLAFCEKAVREMDGTLTVTSDGEGKGATFLIHFPKQA